MTVVAVTGASGCLGRSIIERLDSRDDVSRIVGVDVVETGFTARNLEFYRLDVRDRAVVEVLRGCDVVVHLATAVPGTGDDDGRDIDVGGTRCVTASAAEAGVGRVVVRSGAHVYGAHPDNDFPLTEDSPVRPLPGLSASVRAAEVEEIASALREAHPGVRVAVLRLAPVVGPGAHGDVSRMLAAARVPRVDGYDPHMQLLHPDDATTAFELAMDAGLDGTYNVAPDGWTTLGALARETGRKEAVIGHADAPRRLAALNRMGLTDLDPAAAPFLMYPWAVSNEKIRAAGFTPRHTSSEALSALLEGQAGRIHLGPVSVRPRNLAVAAAGAAAVAGGLARRRARRRDLPRT